MLAHLLDSFECLTTALNFGTVPTDEANPSIAYEAPPVHDLTASGHALIAAARRDRSPRVVRIDDLTLDRDRLVLVGAIEAAVHGWDISQGAGDRGPSRRTWPRDCCASCPRSSVTEPGAAPSPTR